MELKVRVLTPEEREYTYPQSRQIIGQTGCIGHLRAILVNDGNPTISWETHYSSLKTQEFKKDLDAMVKELLDNPAYEGLLKDSAHLEKYRHAHPETAFGSGHDFGLRVDTEKYSYLLRLNPDQGFIPLHCFCYVQDWLNRHIEQARKGIRFIDPNYQERFRIPDGDAVRITTATGEIMDRTARYIDDYHVEMESSFSSNIYHICELAERLERSGSKIIPLRSSLPESCYVYLPTEHRIGIVKKGESGYYRADIAFPTTREECEALVDELNARGEVTKAQANSMAAGSMFGWDTKAADPANYDSEGRLRKAGSRNRGGER